METLTIEHKSTNFSISDGFERKIKSDYQNIDPLRSEEITITPDGVISSTMDKWEIVNDIYALVKEVGQHKTILKCVIDQKLRIFQDRIFDTQMLSKVVSLRKGQLILIKQRQGMRGKEYQNLLSFSDGTGLIENTEEFFNLRPDTDLKSLNPDIFGTPLK